MDTRTNPAVKVYHVRQKSCDEAPSEELTTTLIHFADGATASLCDGTTIGGFNDTGAIGSDADVRMQGDRITVVGHGPTNPEGRPGNLTRNVREIEVPSGGKGLDRVLGLFADAVRCGDDSGLMTFPRMVNEYHILEAMARSAETGEAVEVG
jgi:predicted dehydrogenase